MLVEQTVNLNELEDLRSSGAYIKRELQIVRGDGATLWDNNGNRYIDFVGGQGAANIGHRHPVIHEAITRQLNDLVSCPEFFHNPVRAQYQDALCRAADMPRVFLGNSGAEANEAALKIARLKTGRTGVIGTMRAFHGRTMGALSLTWEKSYREPFLPLLQEVTHVPYNNLEKLAAALTSNTAAVMLEVVQGEGGVHPAQAGYLQAVRELCDKNGTLLIFDEVQTGFGRTGTLFAHQFDAVKPDLMTVAKSMAGGIPMGALLMNESIGVIPPASHGSTFGGNPLACAAGLAVLDVLNSLDLATTVQARGDSAREYLRETLSTEIVREVRGRGFMFGIELRGKVAPVLKALQERGLVALPAGPSVLRLLPPLIISDEQLWEGLHIVAEVVNNYAA